MQITIGLKAIVAVGAIALLAAGCGSSGSGSDSDAKGSAATNPYNLITPGTLLTSTSGSQPPFTVVKGGGEPTGFTIDLNNEVAKRLGLKVDYKLTTSAAGIQGLTSNQYDIVGDGLGVTDERKKSIAFAKGEYWSTTAALAKKTAGINSMDALAGKKVAVITGSVQVGYLKKIQGAVATSFETSTAAVSALNSGSVDAFLVGGPDAEAYLKQFPDLTIAASQPVDHETTVAFQKTNTALVNAYDKQLQAMVDDGTFKTIYQKYFSQAPEPQLLKIWPGLGK